MRLGILRQAKDISREIRDHAVRSHRRADACARANDHRFARCDALEERADERSLADAGVADDHDLSLAPGDEHVAPRITQRLELEITAVQPLGRPTFAQPLGAFLGTPQPKHPRALDPGIRIVIGLAPACPRAAAAPAA